MNDHPIFRAKHADAYALAAQAGGSRRGRPVKPYRGGLVANVVEQGVHAYANESLRRFRDHLDNHTLEQEREVRRLAADGCIPLSEETLARMQQATIDEVLIAWKMK
jgi:hypothetical protein